MHSTIMDPTVGTFAGFIVEPIDVLTMDMEDILRTRMEDILRTPTEDITEDILRTRTEDIIVRPISGDGTNTIVGTRRVINLKTTKAPGARPRGASDAARPC